MMKFGLLLIILLNQLTGTGAYWKAEGVSEQNVFIAQAIQPVSPTSIPSIEPSRVPSATDHIVIGEVQISTAASANNDFIELYNPTAHSYDLNGHRLVKRGASSTTDTTVKSWNTQTIIQPYSFYLWASSDNSYHLAIHADTATSENIASNNSIALRLGAENTGIIIDALSWNPHAQSLKESVEFSAQPGPDQSLERKAHELSTADSMREGGIDELKGNSYDSNQNISDFILRSQSDPQNAQSVSEHP